MTGDYELVDVVRRGSDTEPDELAAGLGPREVSGEIALLR